MRFRFALPIAVLLALPLGACKKRPLPKPLTEGGAGAASTKLPELVKKYRGMSSAERMQAAKDACYVGDKCNALEAKALFQAAPDAEKSGLQAAARPVFADQYKAALVAKGKKPDSVATTGDSGTTLELEGPPCDRFLLSNFMGDYGAAARMVGFKRFACENKALKAKIDLDQGG